MKQVYKYDENGAYVEPVMIYPNENGEYILPENCTDQELPQPNWKPVFDKEENNWAETFTLSLDDVKQQKMNELNQACNLTIIGQFSTEINGITYSFSNDDEAQKNFDKGKIAFLANMTTTAPWTAYDSDGNVVRLTLTEAQFDSVYLNHLLHINNNISKFRDDLEPRVNAAQTVDEINQINWA